MRRITSDAPFRSMQVAGYLVSAMNHRYKFFGLRLFCFLLLIPLLAAFRRNCFGFGLMLISYVDAGSPADRLLDLTPLIFLTF